MKLLRSHLALAVSFGLLAGGSSLSADDSGHDHDAMKLEKKIAATLAKLSASDREQAKSQRFCPLMVRTRLGADGKPIKVEVAGESIFVCCKGCADDAKDGGEATLKKVRKLRKATANMAKLSPEDRVAAEAQKFCAVQNKSLLGVMGPPTTVNLNGQSVFLCCGGCSRKAKADPEATIAAAKKLKKAGAKKGHSHSHSH